MKHNPREGGSLDEFLARDCLLEEVTAIAAKRAICRQLIEAMSGVDMTKSVLARRMRTSRASLDRLLDEENTSITLATLSKAAVALGGQVRLEFEPADRKGRAARRAEI